MESLVYNYYGYLVNKIDNGTFEYEGFIFLLVSVTDNENDLINLSNFSLTLRNLFNNEIVYFVKNKYQKIISKGDDNTSICLLTYKKDSLVSLNDILIMQNRYSNFNSTPVDLKIIIKLWDERTDYIINQCLISLNLENDNDKELYDHSLYAYGMAMNAIEYIVDLSIDYPNNYYPTTLNHRRIKSITKFELFNPFNFILDHSSRDLAELYKNNLIDLNTLLNITNSYHYNLNEYEYLLARVMFPTFIFDLLEDLATTTITNKKEQIFKAIDKQNNQLKKIKSLMKTLSSNYNIRPIKWLNQ